MESTTGTLCHGLTKRSLSSGSRSGIRFMSAGADPAGGVAIETPEERETKRALSVA